MTIRLSKLTRRTLYCCLVLTTLTQRCGAQDRAITISITVPLLLVVCGLILISVCFCIYQCQTYRNRRNYNSRRLSQTLNNYDVIQRTNHARQTATSRPIIAARPHPAMMSSLSETSFNLSPTRTDSHIVPQTFEQ